MEIIFIIGLFMMATFITFTFLYALACATGKNDKEK